MYPRIILKPGKERSVLRFHPWIFSGAIQQTDPHALEGGRVQVLTHAGKVLGWGHYQKGSITVRLLQFGISQPENDFWVAVIKRCVNNRKSLGFPSQHTNAFRLVHGEGDGLPGLIIDVYGTTAVVQCHSTGMFAERNAIAEALMRSASDFITAVYDKSAESLGNNAGNSWLAGSGIGEEICFENHLKFKIDFVNGQKTGFFIDQRDNRQLLGAYSKDKTVLNTFCYTGGFSVAALAGGASTVTSVDSSSRAVALTDENVALNEPGCTRHQSMQVDVPEWLKTQNELYDVIVLDPPAFAKHLDARHRAVQAYKRLNIQGLKRLRPGGLLFTFSCSQVVDRELFRHTISAAAIEAGKDCSIIHQLSQPPDHPVNPFHPESEYLKGFVLMIR